MLLPMAEFLNQDWLSPCVPGLSHLLLITILWDRCAHFPPSYRWRNCGYCSFPRVTQLGSECWLGIQTTQVWISNPTWAWKHNSKISWASMRQCTWTLLQMVNYSVNVNCLPVCGPLQDTVREQCFPVGGDFVSRPLSPSLETFSIVITGRRIAMGI